MTINNVIKLLKVDYHKIFNGYCVYIIIKYSFCSIITFPMDKKINKYMYVNTDN